MTELTVVILPLSDVSSAALPDLCAEAVSASERSERSVHRGNQLLQSHPHGHQLPTGTERKRLTHTPQTNAESSSGAGCYCS